MSGLEHKLKLAGPKKLLALDGGGIRGALTIEILAGIEAKLRSELGQPGLLLSDYFDYIAGTSTGAIIAACLSWGMSTAEVREFYEKNGETMFDEASLLKRATVYKYEDRNLAEKLKEIFVEDNGELATLGTKKLGTLLMLVMRNADTDSPWWVSNNPFAKYNLPERRKPPHEDCNLDLPLWRLIRASTAAPVFFPSESIQLGKRKFDFVDGGVTPHNNPAFQLFIMATAEAYRLCWPSGEDRMLIVSCGTGASPDTDVGLLGRHHGYQATHIPNHLMFAALNEQDMLCRVFGKCLAGAPLDREVGNLIGAAGPVSPKLFTYMRYNAILTRDGLDELGQPGIDPEEVRKLDSVKHIRKLQAIGQAVAAQQVDMMHFKGFL